MRRPYYILFFVQAAQFDGERFSNWALFIARSESTHIRLNRESFEIMNHEIAFL